MIRPTIMQSAALCKTRDVCKPGYERPGGSPYKIRRYPKRKTYPASLGRLAQGRGCARIGAVRDVVYNCGRTPEVQPIQDPARLAWEAVMAVEHYRIGVAELINASQ